MTNVTVEELIVKLKLQTKGFNKSTKESKDNLNKQAKAIKKTREQIKTLETAMKPVKKAFDMSALGVMFFGMAIKRLFTQIMTVGINTFTDVMHSVEGTVTVFDRLKTSIEIIKFELGSAISAVLEPFLPLIIDIATKIADWIRNNDKLAGSLAILGTLVGSVLFLFGTLKLGLTAVGIAISGTAGLIVAGVILLITNVVDFFKRNWNVLKEAVNSNLDIVKGYFDKAIADFKKPFNSFIDFIKNLFSGNFKEAWKDLKDFFYKSIVYISDVWIDLSLLLVNSFRNAFNLIVGIASNQVVNLLNIFKNAFKSIGLDSLANKVSNQINRIRALEKTFTFDMVTRDNMTEELNPIRKEQEIRSSVVINVINPTGEEIVSQIERSITGIGSYFS